MDGVALVSQQGRATDLKLLVEHGFLCVGQMECLLPAGE